MNQVFSLPKLENPSRSLGVGTSQNQLLVAMHEDELRRWAPLLTLVDLSLGQVIFEPRTEL